MATPRKHWFKCPDSVADEDWTNDQLATLIRLQSRLNTRWARNGLGGEDAGRITLTAGDAIAVTHRSSFARAALLLRSCSACVSLTVRVERASVIIEWPKWPEFQGLHSRELPESRPLRDSDSDAPARRKTEEGRGEAASPPAPAPPPDPEPPILRARKTPKRRAGSQLTDPLDPAIREHVRNRAAEFNLDPKALEIALMDWALGKGREYVDWNRQLGLMLRDRWDWTKTLFAVGSQIENIRESAAQKRIRTTNDAARGALEILKQGNLIAIEGGAR